MICSMDFISFHWGLGAKESDCIQHMTSSKMRKSPDYMPARLRPPTVQALKLFLTSTQELLQALLWIIKVVLLTSHISVLSKY